MEALGDIKQLQHVSIHAPRCREAMPEQSVQPNGSGLFQSTP
ncbi:MAG: hypothetical protein RLZZ298_472, partial [Pseudomonadota bacterium]